MSYALVFMCLFAVTVCLIVLNVCFDLFYWFIVLQLWFVFACGVVMLLVRVVVLGAGGFGCLV